MTQPSLFDLPEHGRARHSDPETSKAAAASIEVSDLEGRVVECLRRYLPDGLTAREIAFSLQVELNSISPRTAPLVEKGLIYDSGETRRSGKTGRRAIVWKAVQ